MAKDTDCPHTASLDKAARALAASVSKTLEEVPFDATVTLVIVSNVCDCVATVAASDDAEEEALRVLLRGRRLVHAVAQATTDKGEAN